MTGPKHLWSGDWERESAPVATHEAREPEPPKEPTAPQTRAHRRSLHSPLVIAVALAVIVGTALGLNALFDGGRDKPRSPQASVPGRTPTAPFPHAIAPPQTIPQQTLPQQTAPSSPTPQSTTPTTPAPATAQGPVVYWSGMQIETISPGEVIIATVRLGSQADRAGLDPGEQLIAVNGHQLNTASDIAPAVRGLRAGRVVTLEIVYGASGPRPVSLALGAPPAAHP
jgi:membrane-associated protease RseP (regulator of RpoE activity)